MKKLMILMSVLLLAGTASAQEKKQQQQADEQQSTEQAQPKLIKGLTLKKSTPLGPTRSQIHGEYAEVLPISKKLMISDSDSLSIEMRERYNAMMQDKQQQVYKATAIRLITIEELAKKQFAKEPIVQQQIQNAFDAIQVFHYRAYWGKGEGGAEGEAGTVCNAPLHDALMKLRELDEQIFNSVIAAFEDPQLPEAERECVKCSIGENEEAERASLTIGAQHSPDYIHPAAR